MYVGSAGKNNRIRGRIDNLFDYSPDRASKQPFSHSLTFKLSEKWGGEKVREFYVDDCNFRIVKTNTDAEAIALEGVLILLLKPVYNKETINADYE